MQQFRFRDMRVPVSVLVGLAFLAAVTGPVRADDAVFPTVRLGTGDQAMGGSRAAFAGTSTGLPGWLLWALTPQFQGGTTPLGASGQADPTYRGVAWTLPLASGLWQRNDRLSFGFSLGNGLGDSLVDDQTLDPRAPHPTPTTRVGAAIGYQVTDSIGLYVMFDHVSVSGIAREDEISNDLGMRLGLRF
jgi:hypothetical protein